MFSFVCHAICVFILICILYVFLKRMYTSKVYFPKNHEMFITTEEEQEETTAQPSDPQEKLESILTNILGDIDKNKNVFAVLIKQNSKEDTPKQKTFLTTINRIYKSLNTEQKQQIDKILQDDTIKTYATDYKINIACATNLSMCTEQKVEGTCGSLLANMGELLENKQELEKYKTVVNDIKNILNELE